MMTDSAAEAPAADEAEKHAPDLMERARDDYTSGIEPDRSNRLKAYTDLEFLGGEQWPPEVKMQREAEGRPCHTINRLPQFVRQITGDIRQMRPAIKAVPVDDRGDPKTADVVAGLFRYIENRSDATSVYFTAADSQVQAGIGHWRVITEYAADTTLDQEIAIRPVSDGIAVVWDPDAELLDRSDARFCFVPIDMSKRAFERAYPDRSAAGFGEDDTQTFWREWYGSDYVRIAEYWFKEETTRTILVVGEEVTDITDDEEAMAVAPGLVSKAMAAGILARIEKRPATRVMRALISGCEVLEEAKPWPGRFIPIVPCIGEEIRIGRKVMRHGAIRFARDAQRQYNFFHSAHTETVALQPKAPWLGTEKQFEGYEDEWEKANVENLPYLRYKVDAQAPGPPSRVQAPVSSQGINDGLRLAAEDLKATTGIYDASLGAGGNETSGKAILARQREGDTGSYVYTEHFAKSVAHTGRIVLDLIPHVYDTARTIRIVGIDGKEELVQINQPHGVREEDEEGAAVQRVLHDVTIGAYDVVMEMGPSYNARREEARDGMTAFLQAAPNAAPAVLDLIAKAQDWPMADKIAERLEALAPDAIKALHAKERGEEPPPPSPQEQAQMAQVDRAQQLEAMKHDLEVARLDVEREKIETERAKIQVEREQLLAPPPAPALPAAPQHEPAAPAGDPRIDELAAMVEQQGRALEAIISFLRAPPPANDPGPGEGLSVEPPELSVDPSTVFEPPPGGFFVPADDAAPQPIGIAA